MVTEYFTEDNNRKHNDTVKDGGNGTFVPIRKF